MIALGRGKWVRVFAGAMLIVGVVALWIGHGTKRVQAQFSPAAGTGPGLPETIEAIDSARVTTRATTRGSVGVWVASSRTATSCRSTSVT